MLYKLFLKNVLFSLHHKVADIHNCSAVSFDHVLMVFIFEDHKTCINYKINYLLIGKFADL